MLLIALVFIPSDISTTARALGQCAATSTSYRLCRNIKILMIMPGFKKYSYPQTFKGNEKKWQNLKMTKEVEGCFFPNENLNTFIPRFFVCLNSLISN